VADPLVDLVASADASAYLVESGLAVPATLDKIITAVSAAMQSHANRRFPSQSYAVTLDGPGGGRLSLPNYPITAVGALQVDGVAIPAAVTPTSVGYAFSETQIGLRGMLFCRGFQNVALGYTAGFATIPADLSRACCEGIAAVVAAFQYNDPRVVEVKAGGSAIKLGSLVEFSKLCLTSNVTATLEQYKRVHPC
jgi:hypothetical protein